MPRLSRARAHLRRSRAARARPARTRSPSPSSSRLSTRCARVRHTGAQRVPGWDVCIARSKRPTRACSRQLELPTFFRDVCSQSVAARTAAAAQPSWHAKLAQATPPTPEDETVFIEKRPALDVYVASFGGWAKGSTYLSHAADASDALEGKGITVDPAFFYTAGYVSVGLVVYVRMLEVACSSA